MKVSSAANLSIPPAIASGGVTIINASTNIPVDFSNQPFHIHAISSPNHQDSLLIAWSPYPDATSYNLYYSTTEKAATATKILAVKSLYRLTLPDSSSDYYLFLTAVVGGQEQKVGGYIRSFLYNGRRINHFIPLESSYYANKHKISKLFFENSAYAIELPKGPVDPLSVNMINTPSIVHTVNSDQVTGGWIITDVIANWYAWGICIHNEISLYNGQSYMLSSCAGYTPLLGSSVSFNELALGYRVYTLSSGFAQFGSPQNMGAYPANFGEFPTNNPLNIIYRNDHPAPGSYTITAYLQETYGGAPFDPACRGYASTNPLSLQISSNGLGNPNSYFDPNFGFATFISRFVYLPDDTVTIAPADPKIPNNPIKVYLRSDPNTAQLTATLTSSGTKIDLTNDQWRQWTSSDPSKVYISRTGEILWNSAGTVTITALARDTMLGASATATVEVMCRDYTQYRQDAGPWATQVYAYHKPPYNIPPTIITIADNGCATTSSAMAISSAGNIINPGTLDTYMSNAPPGTFYEIDNTVKWLSTLTTFSDSRITVGDVISFDTTQWANELDNCSAIIARIKRPSGKDHFVLVFKHNGNQFIAYDPLQSGESVLNTGAVKQGIILQFN